MEVNDENMTWPRRDCNICGKCSICDRTFDKSGQLGRHLLRHAELYMCVVCSESFKTNGDLMKHEITHIPGLSIEKKFKCSICPKTFVYNSGLQAHMNTHSEGLLLKCDSCNKWINIKKQRRSYPAHTGEQPHKGEKCGESCTRPSVVEIPFKKSFLCRVCAKARAIEIHGRPKRKRNPLPLAKRNLCSICGMMFRTYHQLKEHFRTHTGDKPLVCPFCDKTFSHTASINRHKLVHTGEKRYHCDLCDKRFKDCQTLKDHLRVHSGDRPFECKYCDKKFRTKHLLRCHTFVHTNERPYKCAICLKGFNNKFKLQMHLKIHNKIKH